MKSPAYATAIRSSRSAKAVTSAGFIKEAGEIFGKTADEIPYGITLPESIIKIYPNLKDKVFDPAIADEISRTYEKIFNPKEVGKFLKMFDTLQDTWKSFILAPFAKYHFRNMAGNAWNNYLAGVVNPVVYAKAAALQNFRKTGNEVLLKPFGLKSWQAKEIISNAEKTNVLSHGQYGADIPRAIEKEIGKPSFNPISRENIVVRGGKAVGTTLENNARLAHFIDKLEKGSDVNEAAMSVKKFLFDYGDLTNFEKQVMKRMMPFYTWSRKNIPLQVEQLIKQPQKFIPVEKLVQQGKIEDKNKLKNVFPQIYERLPFEFKRTDESVTYFPLEGLIPAADLSKISRPHELVLELLTPYIKIPIELSINKSFYNEKEIEKYDNETQEFLRQDVPVKWKYALTTVLPQSRILNEINKLVKKEQKEQKLTADEQAMSQMLISVYKVDLNELSSRAIRVLEKKVDDLKYAYKWAVTKDRKKEADRIMGTINKVVKELEKF